MHRLGTVIGIARELPLTGFATTLQRYGFFRNLQGEKWIFFRFFSEKNPGGKRRPAVYRTTGRRAVNGREPA